MSDLLGGAPEVEFKPGQVIIEQDRPLNRLHVLKQREVEIVKDGISICKISKEGSAFGEISAPLDIIPTAWVVAVNPSRLVVMDDAIGFLGNNPGATPVVARLLAHRVRWLTANYAQELEDGNSTIRRYR